MLKKNRLQVSHETLEKYFIWGLVLSSIGIVVVFYQLSFFIDDDFESFFSRAVPEDEPYYKHIYEGSDDLPSHIKASLLGNSVSVPVSDGSFNMGIWQGIYLCEHRNHGGSRSLVVTIHGEGK